jgi:O-antigen/teichoic acid export membrane protein
MLLAIPIQAGFPTLAVRETSKALVSNDGSLIGGIWLWIFRLSLLYFMLLCVFLILFVFFTPEWNDQSRHEVFLAGFIVIPMGALIISQSAIIRGFGKVVVGSIFDTLIRPSVVLVLLAVLLLFFPSYELTPFRAMVIYSISVMIAFLGCLMVLKRLTDSHIRRANKFHIESVSWWRALYPLTIVGGVQLLFGYADIVILGLFQSDEEVGVYRVIVQFSTLIIFGLTVLNQMLHPYFSSLYAEGNIEKLQRLVSVSSRVIFILALFPALLLLFFGETVVSYLYGREYIVGMWALGILVIGQLLNAAFGSVGALLNMTGHEKDAMRGMLIALVVNTFLNFLLIPFFGMEGAAVSTAISLILWNALLRHYVKVRLGIESSGLLYFSVNYPFIKK